MPQLLADGTITHDIRSNQVIANLNQHPLGSGANENFSVPSNYRIPPARIYVVNHSRTRKWKRVKVAVSYRRGADNALMADNKFRELYGNEDMVYKAVRDGRDMNRYVEELKAVVWRLALPGGRFMPIPPSHEDTPEKPILVEVPDGTWDIYLGNYERMQGYPGIYPRNQDGSRSEKDKFDATVQSRERQALAMRWQTRHRPVFSYTDDGETTPIILDGVANPYGILEFIRVTQKPTTEVVDKDYLSALDLFESA